MKRTNRTTLRTGGVAGAALLVSVVGMAAVAGAGGRLQGAPAAGAVDVSRVDGATVDERAIRQTLEVGRGKQFATLGAAWPKAVANLRDGIPTRIRVHPGVYREGEFLLDAQKIGGKAADTLLVIEAAKPGTAVLSGSDGFAPGTWKATKDAAGNVLYYERPWPHDFGFAPGGWSRYNPKRTIEHRRELAFIDGRPLRQVELELYKHTPVRPDPKDFGKTLPFPEGTKTDPFAGVPQDINGKGLYEYQGFRDPKTLPPGTFGVAERDENGNRIFVRPPAGVDWSRATVEVAVRPFLLWSFYKNNLVLRGLTFQHGAGMIEARGAVLIGHWLHTQDRFNNTNVLVEDCTFRWNNNNQLVVRYARDVTLRRNKVLYGAYGGILTGTVHDLLWEDNETSFNNWRVSGGWASGPVKVHQTYDAVFRGHTSVGNFGTGLWFDVTCGNVLVEDATLVHNGAGFDWEISKGLHFRRGLVANNRSDSMWIPTGSDMLFEDSIFYGGEGHAQIGFEAGERTSGQEITRMLGRPEIDKYRLGPMTLRNCVIASPGDTPLFFQVHGNPTFYADFLQGRLTSENNVWHSAAPAASFGFARLYDEGWQDKPIRNALGDFDRWKAATGDRTSAWADPRFADPENGDFTLKPGSPLRGRGLPARRVSPARLKEYREFLALGLHLKEASQEVPDIAAE